MPQPSRASTFLLPLATIGFLLTAAAAGQQTPPPPADPSSKKAAPAQDTNEGIPIASEAVKQACGVCHKADDKQRMSRISYRRTTPEGWQETVRRMVTLHSAQLDVERGDCQPGRKRGNEAAAVRRFRGGIRRERQPQ